MRSSARMNIEEMAMKSYLTDQILVLVQQPLNIMREMEICLFGLHKGLFLKS